MSPPSRIADSSALRNTNCHPSLRQSRIICFTCGPVNSRLAFSWPSVTSTNTMRAGRSVAGMACSAAFRSLMPRPTASCSGVLARGT